MANETKKKVLVTGANGLIGTALRRILGDKYEWSALNRRDLLVLYGQYGDADLSGIIPLSDGAGDVAAVGADVIRFKPGDRVAAIFFQSWLTGKPDARSFTTALGRRD